MPKKVVDDVPTLKIHRDEKIIVLFPEVYTLSDCFGYLEMVTRHYPKHQVKDIALKWRLHATNLWSATIILTQPLCDGRSHNSEVLFDENENENPQ